MTKKLSELLRQEPKITIASSYIGISKEEVKGEEPNVYKWSVTVKCGRKRFRTEFHRDNSVYFGGYLPNVNDIMISLLAESKVGEESFENYCRKFGLDSSDRKEYDNWYKCVKINSKMKKFLGDRYKEFVNSEY